MAEHRELEYSTAEGNDLAQHEDTYGAFLQITKWSVIIVTVILVFMFLFLT
jgi:hypothetical protein